MRLYFIRHGQSENNALWEKTGSDKGRNSDPELTSTGHEQARRLGEFIAKKNQSVDGTGRDSFHFTHLYTSLMVRSVATGSYISRAIHLPLIAWPEIHECGGIFLENEADGVRQGLPGKPRSYFADRYAHLQLPDSLTEEGWWNRPFESHEDRPLRAQNVLKMLLERHGGAQDRVAIVSHGGFYMELMRVLFNLTEPMIWFLMYNTAVTRVDFRENGERVLVYHNRTEHLPADLLT